MIDAITTFKNPFAQFVIFPLLSLTFFIPISCENFVFSLTKSNNLRSSFFLSFHLELKVFRAKIRQFLTHRDKVSSL